MSEKSAKSRCCIRIRRRVSPCCNPKTATVETVGAAGARVALTPGESGVALSLRLLEVEVEEPRRLHGRVGDNRERKQAADPHRTRGAEDARRDAALEGPEFVQRSDEH